MNRDALAGGNTLPAAIRALGGGFPEKSEAL